MKKIVLTMVALLSLTVAVAQQSDKSEKKMESKVMKQPTPEEMTERMAKDLNLTDAQKSKVLELNKEYKDVLRSPRGFRGPRPNGMKKHDGQMKEGKAKHDGDKKLEKGKKTDAQTGATDMQPAERPQLTDAQKAEMKKHHEKRGEYDKKLKQILNDDQYKSWKKSHGRHRGPRDGKKHEKKD